MRISGGISSLNDNAMAENSRSAPQVGFNQGFLSLRINRSRLFMVKTKLLHTPYRLYDNTNQQP